MEKPENVINWFEIPVTDFERAKKFYEEILGSPLFEEIIMGYRMGFFPMAENSRSVGGAIVQGEGLEPSDKGTTVYLNGGDDLSVILSKVETAGGNVIVPKTQITPEIGFFAMFLDTEGNKVALHSMQ